MLLARRRFCTAALASLTLLAVMATLAQAQPRSIYTSRGMPTYPTLSTNTFIAPGVTLQQYINSVALTRAYAAAYPLGYNPYPAVAPLYPTYAPIAPTYPPYIPPVAPAYNPYVGTPYVPPSPGYPSPGTDPTVTPNPYTGNPYTGSPYTPSYYPDYSTAALARGVAELTKESAQYQVTIQRARLLQEEVTRSRLETRRRIQEEYERERRNMPNPEDIRQREIEISVSRARHDPPLTELLSGKSLNDLFGHLANQQAKPGFVAPNTSLDAIDLAQINLAPANEAGNIGLVKNLKKGEKLSWPSPLIGAAYAEARDKLDARLSNAVELLRTNRTVPASDIQDLEESVKKMVDTLNNSIGDLSPSQYIAAKRYLNQVQDAVTAMNSPGAVNYFNGTWSARGKSVDELVRYMKDKGLKFAPATPGSDGAYRALHYALIAYDANMIAAK